MVLFLYSVCQEVYPEYYACRYRRNLEGGGQGGRMSLQYFSPEEYFPSFGYWVKEGQTKNWGESGENVCMYLTDWFNKNFYLFLTWLLRKLKFLIFMVDFSTPPPFQLLLGKIRPCMRTFVSFMDLCVHYFQPYVMYFINHKLRTNVFIP
jgi:hypothetical protein